MKKFINDITEIGKDLWAGFVYIVELADNAGEIAGEKLGEMTKRKKTVRLVPADDGVKRNCVSLQ